MSLTVRTARSWRELEHFHDAWEALGPSQATTEPGLFRIALEADTRVLRPHAVLLERNGRPHALVLARLERLELSSRIGYRTVYRPTVTALTVVYGGVLGNVDEADAALLLGELRQEVAAGEADVLRLRALDVETPLYAVAATSGRRALRERATREIAHWELELPESYDAFLRSLSKSTRDGAKRYSNKLEREQGDALTLEVFRDVSESERLFRDTSVVASRTYQHGLGVAFPQDEGQRRVTRALMERGRFRAYVLYLAGEPVAFWHGREHGGVFATGVPGFDPAYADLRVGNYVLLRLIADLCADPTIHTLDYGFGDAEYKRRFGTRCRWERDVLLYAPSVTGLRVSVTRGVISALAGATGRALGTGAAARIKRGWRDRLARLAR